MHKTPLHKVIEAIILPKYDWIVDYKIRTHLNDPQEVYLITYFIEPDEDGEFMVRKEMDEVDNLTHTLFKMVDGENKILDNVFYLVKKD